MLYLIVAIIALGLILLIFRAQAKNMDAAQNIVWTNIEESVSTDPGASASSSSGVAASDLDYSEINRAYRIADMHFSRGDLEEGEKWFIRVLALHDAHPEALNRLGVIYIQQGNPRRAEILYRKLLSITQKEPAYYCNYGRCLYNQGRLDEALEAYENAIKLEATKPARYVSVGQIYYERKDYVKALAYFVKALELNPTNREYLSVTAELAELVGDTERQQKSLRKLLEIDPYNETAKAKLKTL